MTVRKKVKNMKTYTKKAVKWLLVIGVLNGMAPFILSALGKDPVAELGIAWITEIVAVIVGYLTKSYLENKQQASQKHADFIAGMYDTSAENPEFEESEDESTINSMEEQK